MSAQCALAVRQAAPQSRAAPVTLQRSCACEQAGESCTRCAGKRMPLQRLAASGGIPSGMPSSVGDVLRTSGRPLPVLARRYMESSFGHDFSTVRIHADEPARSSAAEVHARAYTVGQHVVLGRSAPDLGSTAGRRLLGHELAHVVQQSRGVGVGIGIDPDPALEREADSVGAAVAAGRPAVIRSHAPLAIQRDAEAASFPMVESVTAQIVRVLGIGEGPARVVAASIEGGVSGFSHQWNEGKTGERLKRKLKDFSWTDAPGLVKGYVVGAFEGLLSPISDLFSIAVMVEELQNFMKNLAVSALSKADELAQDLRDITTSLSATASTAMSVIVSKLRESPRQTLNMVASILTSNGNLVGRAVEFARAMGRSQGESLAASLESPWENKKEPEAEASGPLGMVKQWVGRKIDAALDSPWSKVGNKAGYALGFAFIQVVLLVFSEGIGNFITWIGRGLGGLAKAGTLLGRTLAGVGKFVAAAGSIITKVENLVNGAVSLLLKPVMPVLEPILKPFAAAMERLGGFLRKLLGIAEKDATQLATTAATKALGGPHAPVPHAPGPNVPSVTATGPHGGAHAPAPRTTPPQGKALNAEALPAAKTAPEPHTNAKAPPKSHPPAKATPEPPAPAQKPHEPAGKAPSPGSDARHKPLAEPEPVGGGHHTQVTPEGIELCSPPPCPNLRLVYKRELAGSQELRKEMERLDALRKIAAQQQAIGKPDPAFAKRLSRDAAQLQKKLEATKLGKPMPLVTPPATSPAAVKPKKPARGPATGRYADVRGHHVHQSASMSPKGKASAKGNPNHPDAIAIQQGVPGFTHAQHKKASAVQSNVNRAIQGKPHDTKVGKVRIKSSGAGKQVTPSIDKEDAKAYFALRAAGRSPEEAYELVKRSRKQIEASGTPVVRVPDR